MKEETCYVVVDKDGTEKISNSLPIRRKGIRSVWWGLTQVFYSKNNSNKWGDGFSNDEKDALPFMGVHFTERYNRKNNWKENDMER